MTQLRTDNKSKFVQVFLRAHTVAKLGKLPKRPQPFQKRDPKWTKYALAVDCETTRDTIQDLTFGSGRFCREDRRTKQYICIEETFFYRDDLPEINPEGLARLREYVATHNAEVPKGYPPLQLRSRSEVMKRKF